MSEQKTNVNISLRGKKGYGKINYHPNCKSSLLIIELMSTAGKHRVAFSQANVNAMKAIGWNVEITGETK